LPLSVALADFNGDRKLDLAVANNGSDTVSVLLGIGDGTFQTHVDYSTGPLPMGVAIGDLNVDGKPDVVVANNGNNTVSVLLGFGDGTFQPHVDYATAPLPAAVAVADFNGDGKPDLVVADIGTLVRDEYLPDTGEVSLLLGNGDGTLQGHSDFVTGTMASSVTVGDFNGDGALDVATANAGLPPSTVSILLNTGGPFVGQVSPPNH